MTTQINQTKLPFTLDELTTKENFKIPVYPDNQHWLAAMKEKKSQHPEDSKPVEKLMKALVEIEEGVWGFELPRKCCLFVAERNLIKEQASARNEAILRFARLCQKISVKLKKPIDRVQKMMQQPFQHMNVLDPWMEEITASLTSLDATDMGCATATVILQQRLIPHWTDYDTLALPEALFNILLDYADNEQKNWQPVEAKIEVEAEEAEEEEIIEGEVEAEVIAGKKVPKQIEASKSSLDN